MVRCLRWHCPPDTGFEIRALAVWGRARYLSVTEAPHNTDFHTWMGKKHFCFFQTAETGNRTPNSGVKGSGANHYPRAPARIVVVKGSRLEGGILLLVWKWVLWLAKCVPHKHTHKLWYQLAVTVGWSVACTAIYAYVHTSIFQSGYSTRVDHHSESLDKKRMCFYRPYRIIVIFEVVLPRLAHTTLVILNGSIIM